MLVTVGTLLTVFTIFTSGIEGQCINCNVNRKFYCRTNSTGYYCEPGAKIKERYLEQMEYQTSTIGAGFYDNCTPYPYTLESPKTFCCMYSPRLGCQVALNYDLNTFGRYPHSYCNICEKYCGCEIRSSSLGLKSWSKGFIPHLIITVILNHKI